MAERLDPVLEAIYGAYALDWHVGSDTRCARDIGIDGLGSASQIA